VVWFAVYVFLVPYREMQGLLARRSSELGSERAAAAEAAAERDAAKAELAKYGVAANDRAAADSKRKGQLETIASQLKPGLEELGATVAGDGAVLVVSFPTARVIDANGIDVSDAGLAALKILAGTAKKAGARARIRARASAAPPPRELRSLFRTMGEVGAVRAARLMSALEDAGLDPDHVTIVGEGQAATKARAQGRGKRAPAAPPPPPDRVDVELEPQ
jgi:hypothetical protein